MLDLDYFDMLYYFYFHLSLFLSLVEDLTFQFFEELGFSVSVEKCASCRMPTYISW